AGKDHWLSAGSGVSGCPFNLIFGKKEIRVELSLQRSSKEENKFLFDELISHREQIEQAFGHELTWLRLDDGKSSRIQFAKPADGYNEELWPLWIEWLIEEMCRFEKAMKKPLTEAGNKLRQHKL